MALLAFLIRVNQCYLGEVWGCDFLQSLAGQTNWFTYFACIRC